MNLQVGPKPINPKPQKLNTQPQNLVLVLCYRIQWCSLGRLTCLQAVPVCTVPLCKKVWWGLESWSKIELP